MPEIFHQKLFEHDEPEFLLDNQTCLFTQLIVQFENPTFLHLFDDSVES